ncbi:hypothetical protein DFH07DRAFT_784246 [Mycena maculata]|uniref:Uncharacterized protein n=1 Tax=Mycena maculata TaxID=230809 RepID=A0AAD7HHX9_9AGAR|nr:hypothetical protein DFH07DRAFT_784246 [Mycena maculata]
MKIWWTLCTIRAPQDPLPKISQRQTWTANSACLFGEIDPPYQKQAFEVIACPLSTETVQIFAAYLLSENGVLRTTVLILGHLRLRAAVDESEAREIVDRNGLPCTIKSRNSDILRNTYEMLINVGRYESSRKTVSREMLPKILRVISPRPKTLPQTTVLISEHLSSRAATAEAEARDIVDVNALAHSINLLGSPHIDVLRAMCTMLAEISRHAALTAAILQVDPCSCLGARTVAVARTLGLPGEQARAILVIPPDDELPLHKYLLYSELDGGEGQELEVDEDGDDVDFVVK